jgi:twinkle protein
MMISQRALQWFSERALDPEVVVAMGIYSGRRESTGDEVSVVPDPNGDVLVFPYLEQGNEVSAKYRARPRPDGSKVLWQKKNGRKTFFNADVLDDPALRDGTSALVIVEGEPDCLAVLTAGYPLVVSVPDGAPPHTDATGNPLPPVPETANDIVREEDRKYSYLHNNWHRLRDINRIVLFTDGDGPGERLRDEIARRVGRIRCSFVRYPDLKGRKPDANEVLIQRGASAVISMIANAAPFPVRGIYRLKDFPDHPMPTVYSTGWRRLDFPVSQGMCALMPTPGMFMVVLGTPGSGKSTWTLQLVSQMCQLHSWNVGIASFEVPPVPYVRDILRTHYLGKPVSAWQPADKQAADAWINRHFTFIHADPRSDEEDPTLEWLIEKASDAVIRDGINCLVVDPWNELEHQRRRDESETQYTNRAIRALKRFGTSFDVFVIVVVHPTKDGGRHDQSKLSLYDAEGSSHWVNKPDIGVVIERDDAGGRCIVHGRKFRFSCLGRKGSTDFMFDSDTETYSQ